MAVTNATKLSDFSGFINREQSSEIFQKARQSSAVMSIAKEASLPYNGKSFPVTTGKPSVAWVSEAGQKPASAGSMSLLNMDPKKIAAIIVVSAEVVRANPGGYMNNLRDDLAEAFALAFDLAALYDYGPAGQSDPTGGPFSTNIASTTNAVEIGTATDIHGDLVAALTTLTGLGSDLNGFVLDARVEPMLLNARDGNDMPLYTNLVSGSSAVSPVTASGLRSGSLLGRPARIGKGVYSGSTAKVMGFAGDWTQAVWGTVGGINYDVSNQTAVTINGVLTSLWEYNLVAVRAEAEYGFLVNAPSTNFVKFTDLT